MQCDYSNHYAVARYVEKGALTLLYRCQYLKGTVSGACV